MRYDAKLEHHKAEAALELLEAIDNIQEKHNLGVVDMLLIINKTITDTLRRVKTIKLTPRN